MESQKQEEILIERALKVTLKDNKSCSFYIDKWHTKGAKLNSPPQIIPQVFQLQT